MMKGRMMYDGSMIPSALMDLTGQRFGRLLALSYAGEGSKRWMCRCDCGTIKPFITGNLRRGFATSCGCKNRERLPKHDMIGQKFGLWTVVSIGRKPIGRKPNGALAWICQCECGGQGIVARATLLRGISRSCGCVRGPGTTMKNKWYAMNPDRKRALKSGLKVTSELWAILCEAWGNTCAYCQAAKPTTLDHVTAIGIGGKHEIDNLAPSCSSCNFRKGVMPLDAATVKLNAQNFHARRAIAVLAVQEKVNANAWISARSA